jgi:DNA-binding transcriptional regulator GbsR (MarR family)
LKRKTAKNEIQFISSSTFDLRRKSMSAEAITTVVKMMETLPDNAQSQVVEYIKNYIADLQDELRWDENFKKTESNLIQKARLAKQQMAEGKAQPLNLADL